MGSGESFDPRTWKVGDPTLAAAPAAAPPAAAEPRAAAAVSWTVTGAKFRWWLGPLLSAAILAGGAFAAYQTRGDTPAMVPTASAA